MVAIPMYLYFNLLDLCLLLYFNLLDLCLLLWYNLQGLGCMEMWLDCVCQGLMFFLQDLGFKEKWMVCMGSCHWGRSRQALRYQGLTLRGGNWLVVGV